MACFSLTDAGKAIQMFDVFLALGIDDPMGLRLLMEARDTLEEAKKAKSSQEKERLLRIAEIKTEAWVDALVAFSSRFPPNKKREYQAIGEAFLKRENN